MINDLRDFIIFLKGNNENEMIKDLKESLLYYNVFYSISEILEMFILNNINYLIDIGYIKEI